MGLVQRSRFAIHQRWRVVHTPQHSRPLALVISVVQTSRMIFTLKETSLTVITTPNDMSKEICLERRVVRAMQTQRSKLQESTLLTIEASCYNTLLFLPGFYVHRRTLMDGVECRHNLYKATPSLD
jgi:hypothetical protein